MQSGDGLFYFVEGALLIAKKAMRIEVIPTQVKTIHLAGAIHYWEHGCAAIAQIQMTKVISEGRMILMIGIQTGIQQIEAITAQQQPSLIGFVGGVVVFLLLTPQRIESRINQDDTPKQSKN